MSASKHEYSPDERFERLLIDSARHDELPRNVDTAWQKFDSALRGASLLAIGASGALAARRAQRWLAAKWLIWGALAGSAMTVLGLRAWHSHTGASTALSTPAVPTVAISASSPKVEVAPSHSAGERTETKEAPIAAPRTLKALPHPHRSPIPSAPSRAIPPPSSTLAAQVALLDSARTAISNGAHAEALRLADRYRAEYPNGDLSPEAEVVAIEALVTRADRSAASERAARFLANYPGDPHAARVKWLVR